MNLQSTHCVYHLNRRQMLMASELKIGDRFFRDAKDWRLTGMLAYAIPGAELRFVYFIEEVLP